MESQSLCSAVTIIAFALLFYTYFGYPLALWALTRLIRTKPDSTPGAADWPTVSILISAYNEEAVIAERVENLLELDYPSERLEILIGSDGSADRTTDIVESYSKVRLLSFAERRGKASVLNDLVAAARGEIVVLTDANTFFRPDAVRQLVRTLIHRPYGSVAVGQLELRSPAERGNLDGSYWRFETWIKTLESRVGSLLGANGAIYAFRRERYQPLPPEAIVDDFLIPMLMRLRFGDRIFFVPEARAWERSPDEVVDEFRRRVRIGAG